VTLARRWQHERGKGSSLATVLPSPKTAGAPWRSRTSALLRLAPLPVEPWLLVLFVVTMVAFVTGTILAARQFMAVTSYSRDISANAMPSVLHLSSLRVELRELEGQLDRAVIDGADELRPMPTTITAIHRAAAGYAHTPAFEGEEELWGRAQVAIEETLDQAAAAARLFATGEVAQARRIVEGAFGQASARADAALWNLVDLNVREAQERGHRIDAIRMHAIRFSFILDGVVGAISGLLAVVAFAILFRSSRLLAERASELEQFSGRIAHDIRGPLSMVTLFLGKMRLSKDLDQMSANLDRAEKGVGRATALVEDLLAFASAGGSPQPGARTQVGPAIRAALDDEAEMALENRVELCADATDEVAAACAPGVLSSILSNLVHNAIKYMGDASVRRVVVRSRLKGSTTVRLEVADTGPGIAPDAARRVFEPFFRADTTGRPGIGLGLATVRRLVRAHGGKVGLLSSPRGSTFWVELPRA
jgi:signal transduction histidine kinase